MLKSPSEVLQYSLSRRGAEFRLMSVWPITRDPLPNPEIQTETLPVTTTPSRAKPKGARWRPGSSGHREISATVAVEDYWKLFEYRVVTCEIPNSCHSRLFAARNPSKDYAHAAGFQGYHNRTQCGKEECMHNNNDNRVLARRNAHQLSAEELATILGKGNTQMTQLPSIPFYPDF